MGWSEEYATGIALVDQQHQMIFRMAADAHEALDHGEGERTYTLLLKFLREYCANHFRIEEQYMDRYRCPLAEPNKRAHDAFLRTIDDFKRTYLLQGYRPQDARELVGHVDEWLSGHIIAIDLKMRDCVPGG